MSKRWTVAIALLLLLGIGLFFRVATISHQSLWYDEWQGVGQIPAASSLSDWMQRTEDGNRDMVPLYFIIEYFWYRWFAGSMLGTRWLCVLFGMLVILGTYRFGRDLYGSAAGLLAAACCAFSPLHIYFSQELRPYGLVALLGLLSAYAFHRALFRGGTRWWVVNALANVLLMWTHLFGLWLIVTEGCFLLAARRRPFRRVLTWSIANALPMIPVGLLVLSWKDPGDPPLKPPLGEILAALPFMDGWDLAFRVYLRSLSTPRDYFHGLPSFFLYLFPVCAALFSGVLLAAAALHLRRSMRRTPDTPRETALFLLLWYVLPYWLLLLFTVAVVPAFQLRYLIYSSPALYILAAAGIMGLRNARMRRGVAATLLVSLGVVGYLQAMLPSRPDDTGAAHYVQANVGLNEVVLWQPEITRATFEFNLDPTLPHVPIAGESRLQEEFAEIDATLEKGLGVWVLHGLWHPEWAKVRAEALDRYLARRGIAYTRRVFPGRWDNIVYYCTRGADYAPVASAAGIARLQNALTPDACDAPLRARLLSALETAGRLDEAAALCRAELRAIPSDPAGRAAVERILISVGWDDRLDERSYWAGYASDYVAALERILASQGLGDASANELQQWRARFPDNPAFKTAGK